MPRNDGLYPSTALYTPYLCLYVCVCEREIGCVGGGEGGVAKTKTKSVPLCTLPV